ncbi:response regulator transcription factor, partial [Chroococcidiopsis sp.]|uniref:response regulator transcription factor n=1 Tax=Chroococcidiopsis sp. TaxID=3088168 RepID=UPI003F307B81
KMNRRQLLSLPPIQARRLNFALLSHGQLRYVRLVASGLSNQEIADFLGVSTRTVESMLRKSYTALNVKSRFDLIATVRQSQLIN